MDGSSQRPGRSGHEGELAFAQPVEVACPLDGEPVDVAEGEPFSQTRLDVGEAEAVGAQEPLVAGAHEQVAGYVAEPKAQTAHALRAVEHHLELCPDCGEEYDALRRAVASGLGA